MSEVSELKQALRLAREANHQLLEQSTLRGLRLTQLKQWMEEVDVGGVYAVSPSTESLWRVFAVHGPMECETQDWFTANGFAG